jgi:hypothetical protein
MPIIRDDYFYRMPMGYSCTIDKLPCKPSEPQQYYWKLFLHNERVNGGIAENPHSGQNLASQYANQHDSFRYRSSHFWDEEESRWIPKSQLYYSSER